jgi:hypothetical protein
MLPAGSWGLLKASGGTVHAGMREREHTVSCVANDSIGKEYVAAILHMLGRQEQYTTCVTVTCGHGQLTSPVLGPAAGTHLWVWI